MNTKATTLQNRQNSPSLMNLTRITRELRQGNLVIAPTDTIYGILADALNPAAVEKVKIAKHRDANKPLLLLMNDLDMLHTYTLALTPLEQGIIEKYFPGPLTILLPKNSLIDDAITGGSPLVGIRIPDHPELLEIIRTLGRPLISTSANLAGEPSITNPDQLSPELLQHISYVEDAGTIDNPASTLIKVENGQIKILRPGALSNELAKHYQIF